MKSAENQYYEACELYRKHCEENEVDQDDAKFNELVEDSHREYAKQCCQLTFDSFMELLTPIMKDVPNHARFEILSAIAKTQPVLP